MSTTGAGQFCPSAQPDMADATVLGVYDADNNGLVAYLDHPLPVDPWTLPNTGNVDPLRVLRIAARCEETRCTHFGGGCCSLATRVATLLPAVVELLPRCSIRSECRWFSQEGRAACLRCPQVTTQQPSSSPLALAVAGSA